MTSARAQHPATNDAAPEPDRTAAVPPAPDATPAVRRRLARVPDLSGNRLPLILAGLVILGLAGWVLNRLAHVNISDARIASTMVAVSSRVDGWIDSIPVSEGDRVPAGALLLALDSEKSGYLRDELAARVRSLEAQRRQLDDRHGMVDAQTRSRLDAQRSHLVAAESARDAAASEYDRAEADWQRATPLLEKQIISHQEWERQQAAWLQARSKRDGAVAEVAAARGALAELQASRTELNVIDDQLSGLDHQLEEARAQLAQQDVDLADHQVVSPIAGVIDEIFVDAGEHVSRGQQTLVMHDPSAVWVSANVKETELRHLAVGDPAVVQVDALPDRTFTGRLTRIGNAATSQFALLPNPNPSGNFTKITQRVEVRIDLDAQDADLRPGMMVEVEFDL